MQFHEFDAPIFKVLSNNDTGSAPGHQGGIVIPADLDAFFPRLYGEPNPNAPTLETDVVLELWIERTCVGIVPSRYQYQTWGGNRPPERRLTRGFSAWRNEARGGDVAVFERSVSDENYYRLTLNKEDRLSEKLKAAIRRAAPKRWGVVNTDWQPVRNEQIRDAEALLLESDPQGLQIFADRRLDETVSVRAQRSHSFRSAVMRAYGNRCAVTGEAIFAPSGNSSNDAAHIIPVESNGADIIQNGLALRKDLHWAFDRGLWSISTTSEVAVSDRLDLNANPVLAALRGHRLRDPGSPDWKPAAEAIEWHRENRFLR